jgi:hypothetical protein
MQRTWKLLLFHSTVVSFGSPTCRRQN